MVIINITGDKELIDALNRMASSVAPAAATGMRGAAEEVSQAMREVVPTETGSLQRSIGYDFKIEGNEITARVGPSDVELSGGWGRPVGRAIELGRPPGKPPPWFAIQARYGIGVAEARNIARKIGREGTIGVHFVENTIGLTQVIMAEKGIQIVEEIVSNFV